MPDIEAAVRRLRLGANGQGRDSDFEGASAIEDLKLLLAEYDRLVKVKDHSLLTPVPPLGDSLGASYRREDGSTFYTPDEP